MKNINTLSEVEKKELQRVRGFLEGGKTDISIITDEEVFEKWKST